MKTLLFVRTLIGIVLALLVICVHSADAQTWQWEVVVHTPSAPPVNAESRVVLSPIDLTMSYSAQIQQRRVTIASCHMALTDIANVKTMRSTGRAFLLLNLKPHTPASCSSGRQSVAMVPVADDDVLTRAVAAINHACCTPAVAVAASPPIARYPAAHSPIPSASAPAAVSAKPPQKLTNWVEKQGVFAFIRVRNRFSQPVAVTVGKVSDCRNVAYGCGPFPGSITLPPGTAATVATVMSDGQSDGPSFTYRYTVESGQTSFAGEGSSASLPVGWRPRMSAQQIITAEASAIAGLHVQTAPDQTPAPEQTAPPAFVDVRLIRRGSSRLGIGQTGVARVRVSLGANGLPLNASIVSVTNPQLVAAALETAVSSTYAPAMRKGEPVPGTYIATFQFNGEDPATASIPVWRQQPLPSPSPSPP